MKLERVDIFGFKSFPERTELTFHDGVTAIVGPNGCGKSNISDAIGWALGEQSAKSLRGQKMEDLIFSGTEGRPPLGLAEVNLRLSHVNGTRPDERREVVVTRRLYRSGTSEYLMDGAPCRLRDIHELFMDTGVGTKAYSIIEQGKIGLILSSKPTDRRGLIEEAAGITRYKARRRSAELKLQAAQQNLLRVNDIVYEVERQMASLKRHAAKARRHRRLADAVAHLEKLLAVRRSRRVEARLAELGRTAAAAADEELRRSTSLAVAEAYLERLGLELAEGEAALARERDELHRLELAAERRESQITRARQQLADIAARRERLDAELAELEARRRPSADQLAERERAEAEAARELAELEARAEGSQGRLAEATRALAELERRIEEGRTELVHRISKIAALRNFLDGVLANTEKVSTELVKLEAERRELEAERTRLERETAEVDAELGAARARADELDEERRRREDEAAELARLLAEAEARRAECHEELSTLAGRLAEREELVAARKQYEEGARRLLTEGATKGIRVLGSVADAIDVDPRFERAAERFLGPTLQRILVDGLDDVRAARRVLVEENAGHAELLVAALVGEAGRAQARGASTSLREQGLDGILGTLGDAVRWKNGLPPRLRNALPDAVVVDSLETAFRAYEAEPSCAYVTVDGDVVAPPGVVRLGAGGAGEGLLETPRELRELRERKGRVEARLATLEAERSTLEARAAELRTALERLVDERHGLDKKLVGLEHRRRQLAEEEERLGRKAEVVASEQTRAESERGSLGLKRTEMEASLAAEEQARERLDAELAALRRGLAERRAEVETLRGEAAGEASRVAALRERVQALRVDLERLREGMRELETRIEQGRAEKRSLADREEELGGELAEAEADIARALAERARRREGLVALEERVAALRARVETTAAALRERRRELDAVRERRAAEEIALAREEAEKSHLHESFRRAHGIDLDEAAAAVDPAELEREDDELEASLAEARRKLEAVGPVNPMADEEFRELEQRHGFLTSQRQDLLDSIASTEAAIRRIDATSRRRFEEAFEQINRHFEQTFRKLFGGGRAGLRLVDESDPLESGIDIIAQPPGKKLQNVLLLSGGEKAMTAIALMFAIFRYKPSPFCLLDEVDAPLDDANVGRFLEMLRELTATTQFIIITHNRKTMEMADRMYGVTMEEPGVSKLVSVSLVEARPAELVASPAR